MPSIKKVTPMTENPYVRLYHLDVESKTGKAGHYYVASRAKDERHLKLNTRENHPDGVIIYAVCKEDKNKVVLVRQYRYAIDDYIYEFPAGLVETGEDFKTAGIREMKEETGLTLEPVTVNPAYEKPYQPHYRPPAFHHPGRGYDRGHGSRPGGRNGQPSATFGKAGRLLRPVYGPVRR